METSRVAGTAMGTGTGTTAVLASTSKTPDWLSAQIHGCNPFTHLLSVTHLASISLALTNNGWQTDTAVLTQPTFDVQSKNKWPQDDFVQTSPSLTNLRPSHPRLIPP